MSTVRIAVCIASIGRPSLADLLRGLAACTLRPGMTLAVRIADDSADAAVGSLVGQRDWGFPIEVLAVGSGNISTARNATLSHAEGDYVAFIDDDEVPSADWLVRLVDTAVAFEADAVIGSVRAVMPTGTAAWIRAAAPFDRRPGATGRRLSTGVTSNALVKLSTIRKFGLKFDESLGRTGGEDTQFFSDLADRGGSIVACEEAVVHETIPPERLAGTHLRTRYMRGGYSHARSSLRAHGAARQVSFGLRSAVKLAIAATAAAALSPFRRDLSMRFATKAWAAQGELMHAAGRPSPRPY